MQMVENILLFARSRRAPLPVADEVVHVGALVRDVVRGFEPLAGAAGATLRVLVDDPTEVQGDTRALRQILLNLLDNAAKYGPSGQTITVRVARGGGRRMVRLSVCDQGPGIPGPERERVWSPYVRLRTSGALARGGSGIGLSVVKELAESLSGRVGVDDAPGGGACFTVDLPVAEPARAGASA
jgi:signal transduction histidine kinase